MGSVPSDTRIRVLIGVLCLIWGSTWLVIKVGLEDLPPFLSVGVRFAIAAAVMTLVAPGLRRLEGGEPPPRWLTLSTALTQFSVTYGLVYWSETYLSSSLACLVWAVFPLIMAVAGHFFLPEERITGRHLVGFVIGFIGVATLFWNDIPGQGEQAVFAATVLLLSPLICAVGTVILKRNAGHVSSALLNRNGLSIGAVLLLGYSWLSERDEPAVWTAAALWSIAYLSLVGTCVAFAIYFWLLRHAAATRLSLITYVTPTIALFLGWLILDEAVRWHTMLGAGLVVLGIAVVVRR